MMDNKSRALWLSISLLTLTLGLLLGALLSGPAARAEGAAQAEARARAEYHRGAYDTCQIFAVMYYAPADVPGACLTGVRAIIDAGWYGEPSAGWEWPLP